MLYSAEGKSIVRRKKHSDVEQCVSRQEGMCEN